MHKIAIFQLDNFRLSPFSRNLFNLAPELQKRDCDITLLTTSEQGMDSLPPGVHGRVLGQWMPRWVKLPRHYLAIPQLAFYIRRNRPDAIIARGVPFAVPTLLARMISGCRPRIITTLHSFISGDINTRVYRSWPAFKILARFAIKISDHTVAISAGVAKDYIRLTRVRAEQIKVIYNPVVAPNINVLAAEPISEPWLQSGRKHATLIHVGRFAPEKDHETLLKALFEARTQRDVRLLLLGDGPLRTAIAKIINDLGLSEAVKMLGRQENPFSYMARADALILSSKFEGFGNVLIQSMALGCPVAATGLESGANEILEGGRWGPITAVGNPKELARSIMTVLDKPLPRDVLISRALCFTADESAAKLFRLINDNAKRS